MTRQSRLMLSAESDPAACSAAAVAACSVQLAQAVAQVVAGLDVGVTRLGPPPGLEPEPGRAPARPASEQWWATISGCAAASAGNRPSSAAAIRAWSAAGAPAGGCRRPRRAPARA